MLHDLRLAGRASRGQFGLERFAHLPERQSLTLTSADIPPHANHPVRPSFAKQADQEDAALLLGVSHGAGMASAFR
jgi:hypothetical protein